MASELDEKIKAAERDLERWRQELALRRSRSDGLAQAERSRLRDVCNAPSLFSYVPTCACTGSKSPTTGSGNEGRHASRGRYAQQDPKSSAPVEDDALVRLVPDSPELETTSFRFNSSAISHVSRDESRTAGHVYSFDRLRSQAPKAATTGTNESRSLAAFMGSKRSGPMLNKPSPQPFTPETDAGPTASFLSRNPDLLQRRDRVALPGMARASPVEAAETGRNGSDDAESGRLAATAADPAGSGSLNKLRASNIVKERINAVSERAADAKVSTKATADPWHSTSTMSGVDQPSWRSAFVSLPNASCSGISHRKQFTSSAASRKQQAARVLPDSTRTTRTAEDGQTSRLPEQEITLHDMPTSVQVWTRGERLAEVEQHIFYRQESLTIMANFPSRRRRVWQHGPEDMYTNQLCDRATIDIIEQSPGLESADMVAALGGTLVTRHGSRKSFDPARPALYRVQARDGIFFIDQVDLHPRSVCAAYAYVLSKRATMAACWFGRGCTSAERTKAIAYASDTGHTIEHNPELFWTALGGESLHEANHWRYRLPQTPSPCIYTLEHVRVADLARDEISIIDAYFELYIIVPGSVHSDLTRKMRLATRLANALSAEGARPFRSPIHVIRLPSLLPLDLQACLRIDLSWAVNGAREMCIVSDDL